jgi:uncharacterized membrane protein YdjX (TVP38/TMEM64 family)
MVESHHKNRSWQQWMPLAILLSLVALTYLLGLQNYISLSVIAENEMVLVDYVHSHLLLSILIYVVIYIAVVALSLPGAALLSIFGGFVFGWALSAPITVFSATTGAVIVFQVVKTSLGALVAERAGPFAKKLSDGFKQDAFNYLLFLRLVPAFPFFAVNAVAGLARINLRVFVIATFFGIIPGSVAFAWLGRGLGSVIEAQHTTHHACVVEKGLSNCPFEISIASLFTPQLVAALCALGVVALIPVALKKWKNLP